MQINNYNKEIKKDDIELVEINQYHPFLFLYYNY